jgi:hypothetical protein
MDGSRRRHAVEGDRPPPLPEIVWEHSHVVVGTDGVPKSFCIYEAPTRRWFREHASGSATTW